MGCWRTRLPLMCRFCQSVRQQLQRKMFSWRANHHQRRKQQRVATPRVLYDQRLDQAQEGSTPQRTTLRHVPEHGKSYSRNSR
jgi:hypothetical protein